MMDRSLKILHIFSGVGGGISAWIRKAAFFSGDGVINDAMAFGITNQSNFINIIKDNGGECFQLPRLREGLFYFWRYISSVIKKRKYDVIHCHIDGYVSLLFWVPVCLICRKPMIIHSHRTAIESVAGTWKERPLYAINRMVNLIIAKNKVACGEKAAQFAFATSKGVKIIYNGVNLVDYDVNLKENQDSRIINLLALGRLNKVKNHSFMFKIAERLKNHGYNFHLYIVGAGELEQTLAEMIHEMNLEDNVSLEGYCDNPTKYLFNCDTYLLPSFSEGLPTVMVEAQEYGCNVIASNIITHESDLDLGLVNYVGIADNDIDKWVNLIIANGKKNYYLQKGKIDDALIKKGFVNKYIYRDYFQYVSNLIERE